MAKHIHHTTHNHTVAPAYPQEVHNYAAPTEDTVKLLRELEDEARKNVVAVYRFDETILNGVVVLRKMSAFDFDLKLYIRFVLNGETYEFDVKFDGKATLDRKSAGEHLWERLSKALAATLMPKVAEELVKYGRV